MDTVTLLHTTRPMISNLGAIWYQQPETQARGKELGLEWFHWYFIGRGGVLGDCDPLLVTSAFGYFEPGLVEEHFGSASAIISPREGAREHMRCGHEFGRKHLSGIESLDDFCRIAESIVAAADPGGMALFAGYAAQPLPDDAPARATQLLEVLRELRGSAHLLAVRAVGFTPQRAHFVKWPAAYATYGWHDEPAPATPLEEIRHAQAEALTDELLLPAYGVVSDDDTDLMVSALQEMTAALSHISH